jgi:hypothetical protein
VQKRNRLVAKEILVTNAQHRRHAFAHILELRTRLVDAVAEPTDTDGGVPISSLSTPSDQRLQIDGGERLCLPARAQATA